MSKPGRNDPCPCGSGKKYKKCCLGRDSDRSASSESADDFLPAAKAIRWFHEHFRGEIGAVLVEDYWGELDEEEIDELQNLPDDLREMVWLNAHEWILAEGRSSEGRRLLDLVLDEGPRFTPEERRYLEALGATPLDVFEVVDVKPGDGLTLISKTDPKAKPVWVQEKSGSRSLQPGHYLGARVLPLEPAVLSGAVFEFPTERYLKLRADVFANRRKKKPDPDQVSRAIIRHWHALFLAPPPAIQDASTGQALVLTTVHYRIRDLEALRRALAKAPDVEEEQDDHWVRFEDPDADVQRAFCTLTRKKGDRLELFARTTARADEAEAWLAEVAGDSVKKLTRAISDPRHLWKERFRERPEAEPASSGNDVMTSLTHEQRSELFQKLYRQTYANWADEPIPLLAGKTPRQAIRSKAGRREVVELLKSYANDEQRNAKKENRDPVDFGFLWEELGLERDGPQ